MAGITRHGFCSVIVVLLACLAGKATAGQRCWSNNYQSSTYCRYGCCGTAGYESCCDSTDYSYNVSAAFVVGCVFAGIFVLSFLVCGICICLKAKSHSGRVVTPGRSALPTRPKSTRAVSTTASSASQNNHQQMVAFYHGNDGAPIVYSTSYAAAYPQPIEGRPHHLPPLAVPPLPVYDSSPYPLHPPPAYSAQTPQASAPPQCQGEGQGRGEGQPTTQYGGNFVV